MLCDLQYAPVFAPSNDYTQPQIQGFACCTVSSWSCSASTTRRQAGSSNIACCTSSSGAYVCFCTDPKPITWMLARLRRFGSGTLSQCHPPDPCKMDACTAPAGGKRTIADLSFNAMRMDLRQGTASIDVKAAGTWIGCHSMHWVQAVHSKTSNSKKKTMLAEMPRQIPKRIRQGCLRQGGRHGESKQIKWMVVVSNSRDKR